MNHEKLLEKICTSQEFLSSSIYGKYLSYLVKSSLEEKNLKETTIAIEFFEKDANFNPAEDTLVRSHTYKLRKKLERYYFTEGKNDTLRFKIPKGHYKVDLVETSNFDINKKSLLDKIIRNYQFLIIVMLLVVIFMFWKINLTLNEQLARYHLIDRDNFIWKEYLNSEIPILIVPGDHFMYQAFLKQINREVAIRDMTINSLEEMKELNSKYPDLSFVPAPEPYFPYHSIWSLPSILSILFSVNQYPILRRSSQISPQMLSEYNIIFVGSLKTLYTLKHTLKNSHFTFEINPHKITYTPSDGDVIEFSTPLHSPGPTEDLVLALKIPGPKSNSIMIIASYQSLGAPEVSNYFTSKESLVELQNTFIEKIGHTPKYFEILFKITGIDKTAYSKDILIINELKEE